jgi:hypothetical protein
MFKASLLTRMKIIEKRFEERGTDINNVYVMWAEGDFTPEQRAMDVASALEAYLDGKCTRIEKFDRTENV